MRTVIATLAALSLALPVAAQSDEDMLAPIDLSSPKSTTYSMMRAMYQGDADMVDQVFLEGGQLRRMTPDGTLGEDGLARWRDWISTLEPGDAYEELFGVTAEQFGDLATVWAPFVITYQDEIVGCGVNTLTLARTNGDWRIVFGMDTSEPKETCGDFKARYLADD